MPLSPENLAMLPRITSRMKKLTNKLRRLWSYCPDYRFCQLIVNIGMKDDIFYLEDYEFERRVNKLIKDYSLRRRRRYRKYEKRPDIYYGRPKKL